MAINSKLFKLLIIGACIFLVIFAISISRVQEYDSWKTKQARRQQRFSYDYDTEGLANKHSFTFEPDDVILQAFKKQAEFDKLVNRSSVRWIVADVTDSNVTQQQTPLQYLSFAYRDTEVPRIRLFYVSNLVEEQLFCWLVTFLEDGLVQLAVSVVRRTEFYRGDRRFVDGAFVESGVADCWPTFDAVKAAYVKLSFSRWPVRTHLTPKRSILRGIETGEFARVYYPPARNVSSGSRGKAADGNRLLAIHKMLHGAVPHHDVIEWVEWLRFFSVTGVCVAKYHDLAPDTRRVLDYYETKMDLVTWSIGPLHGAASDEADRDLSDSFNELRFSESLRSARAGGTRPVDSVDSLLSDRDKSILMQGASLNLCSWSNSHRFDFAVVFDLDEVFLPRSDSSYSSLLARIGNKQSVTYVISNLHFLKELQGTGTGGNRSAEPYPRSLQRTVRAGDLNHAWKSVTKLPNCRILHCHYCIEPTDYAARVHVDHTVAAIHHYSYCHAFQTDVCRRLGDQDLAVRDTAALVHSAAISERIASVTISLNLTRLTHYPSANRANGNCCI